MSISILTFIYLLTFNLIGIPFQIILGKKSEGELIEFKKVGDDIQKIDLKEIIKIINKEL